MNNEGRTLDEMDDDQLAAVQRWAANESGAAFWKAQGDPAHAAGHLRAAERLREQAGMIQLRRARLQQTQSSKHVVSLENRRSARKGRR